MKLASDTNGAVALCPKGAALAIADSRGNITLWNVSDGQRLSTLGYHRNVIWAGGFSASGDLIATACGDNSMRLWDAVSGRLIDDFRAHWGAVWDLKFSPGDESLTTLGSDGLVRFWNLAEILKMSNGVGAVTIEGGPGAELEAIYFEEPTLRDIAVSPDSNEAAIATSDKLFVLSQSLPSRICGE